MNFIKPSLIIVLYLATSTVMAADDLAVNPPQAESNSQVSEDDRRLKLIQQLRAATNLDSPNFIPAWSDKVIRKIKANITFNEDNFKGNGPTVVQLNLASDGAILSRIITSSSGDDAWDQEVLKALDIAKSLPKDANGKLPTLTPEIRFKPREDKNLMPMDIGKLVVKYQPNADLYYPSYSKRSGEQGAAVVRLIIDLEGQVEEVFLMRSSGYPRLDRAATEIGKRYQFMPFLVNGKPSIISTNILIKFSLKDDENKPAKNSPPFVKFSDLEIREDGQKSDYFLVEQLKTNSDPFIQVLIEINEAGSVVKATAIKVSNPIVRDKSETIARHYRFKPYFINGKESSVLSVLKIELTSPQKTDVTKSLPNKNKPDPEITVSPKESKATKAKQNQSSATVRLTTLKEMLDKGLITEKDYNLKKEEILRDM
jgi:TonB family protein